MFEGWIEICMIIVLTLLGVTAWIANILGMPGNWVMVALGACCLFFRPDDARSHLGWGILITIIVVSLLGELLEFAAGALGASRVGGSKRGTALAIVGSIVGAILGLFFGTAIPIPIIGNLIGSVMLGALGAFGGAVLGERWAGKDWDSSFQVGGAAFWGRLLGTVAKAVCGTVVCLFFIGGVWLS